MDQIVGGAFAIILIIAVPFAILGWVKNIIKLCKEKQVTGMTFARVSGIFIAPIGSILGFIK